MKKRLFLFALPFLSLHAQAAPIFSDTFTYNDGSLTTVSSGTYTAISGAGITPIQVASDAISGLSAGLAREKMMPPIFRQLFPQPVGLFIVAMI